jgi:hypothetical protein
MLVPDDDPFITATIDIAAPPEAVWQVLTAFSRYTGWHPILKLEGAAPELQPGARLAFRLSGGTAGEQAFVAEVTEVAPPSLLAWQGGAEGVFFGLHTFELQALPGGSTRFTDTERWSGTMAASVIAGHRADLEKEYARIVAALKEQAERGHAG